MLEFVNRLNVCLTLLPKNAHGITQWPTVISCSSCNKQYVGETKGPLNKRMNGHRDDWRHRRFERSPTAEHFHSADHDFLSNASVCCLEHNKEWSDSTRKLRESYSVGHCVIPCAFFGKSVKHTFSCRKMYSV